GTLRTFGAVWTTAWPFISKMVRRPLSNIAIRVASRTPNSVRSKVTVSPTLSARTCASLTGVSRTWWVMAPARSLVIDSAGRDDRVGPARRMALDVHRHRIHGDVGGCRLDVHGERGRAAAEPLWADAELVDRL